MIDANQKSTQLILGPRYLDPCLVKSSEKFTHPRAIHNKAYKQQQTTYNNNKEANLSHIIIS